MTSTGDRGPTRWTIPSAPAALYGRSKLAGEQQVHDVLPEATVVRTAWVYTGAGSDFVGAMRRLESERDHVDVVADQTGSPTYVADLAGALLLIADDPAPAPVLHVANTGPASRYELARAVFAGIGADPQRVRPVEHRPASAARAASGRTRRCRPRVMTPTTAR